MTTYLGNEDITDDVMCSKCNTINSFKNNNCFNCGYALRNDNEEKEGFFAFIFSIARKVGSAFISHLYLVILAISTSYFVIYLILRYGMDIENLDSSLFDIINDVALLIFSAGIFTSSLKYLQYLKVFEKEFQRILLSEKYNARIKKNIESITLSEEFFIKQNNIENIWQTVTLSKYKKEFPEIYYDIKSKLKNELFEKSNIEYYYKNVLKTYTLSLEGNNKDHIKIIEETTYTIVRKSRDKFNWDCNLKVFKEDSHNKEYPIIEFKVLGDPSFTFDPKKDIEEYEDGNYFIRKIDRDLVGSKEYTINRTVTLKQHLDRDREYSFGSSRIIDDLTVSLRYPTDLKVIFSEIRKVTFHKEKSKDLGNYTEDVYINRGIMLPGEKFKLFFIRC